MARYWRADHLDQRTPPQALDARGRAFVRILDAHFAQHEIDAFTLTDFDNCPSAALPALVAEYSLEEFIEPGLPEHIIRRILKNRYRLQALGGYDEGIELGLSMLGMTAIVEQWWAQQPPAAKGTHKITIYLGEQLYRNDEAVYGPDEKRAALRMIDATKRWSQESHVQIGVGMKMRRLTTAQRVSRLRICRARMTIAQRTPRLPLALHSASRSRALSVTRLKLGAAYAS